MPKLTYFAFFTILVCFSLALLACGDDPVSPPKDTTRPTVVSVSPLNGSSFVSVASDISVTFSEAMDQNTMLISSLTIDPAVTGAVSYTDKALTFDPDGFLPGDTTITVTVSTAAKDKAGNALASAYVWQFSTDLDSTPPTVLSTTPAAGAVDVPVSSQIIVRFSEDMAPSSACTAFQIDPVTVGTKTCPDSAMTFAPSSLLLGGQTYEVTMSTTATDTAGNALASDYTWQFTTFNDTSPPIGSIASPGDSAVVGTSTNITVTANDVTGVERVIFYVDGSEIAGSVDSTAPYEYTWTPTGLDTGSVHLITAEMFDVLGHSAFTDTVAVHYLWELLITDDDEELIHRDVNKVHVRSTGSLLEFRVETFGDWVDYVAADSLGINVAIYLDTDQNRATGDTTASDGNPQWEPPGAI
ncbi:MAG: Ig-like domain-containing protein, partial [bacterium]|nr:Ig-like domain-containing protein [bacterium]